MFDALAEMLLKGHALTMVHGNHDADFHWDGVKNDFRDLLLARARVVDAGLDEAAFRAQITFEPWFFYWKNVAYIEHGHQYDTYCATDHLMAPVSPLDPRRLMAGFSGIMLRHVVRHTVGMTEHGHETRGVLDYLAFGARLGLRGLAGLTASFARACAALFRLRAVHFSSAAQAIRTEHERRIVAFGEATRYSAARLRALASLQVEPITRTIRGIMKSVLLDRIALGAASLLALFVVGVAAIFRVQALYGAILVVVAWVATHLYLSLSRTIDPAEEMILRASRVAKVFPTAFVIMGHTHLPVERLLDDGVSTYINLGSWAEDEPPATETPRHAPYTAARTHLVIEMEGEQPRAELRAWAPGGPRKYRA